MQSALSTVLANKVANALDWRILVSEFEPHLHCYVYFLINTNSKGMNALIPPALGFIVSVLFFFRDGFDVKQPQKVDILVNKETKQYLKRLQLERHLYSVIWSCNHRRLM